MLASIERELAGALVALRTLYSPSPSPAAESEGEANRFGPTASPSVFTPVRLPPGLLLLWSICWRGPREYP